jgi:hypothetical protein
MNWRGWRRSKRVGLRAARVAPSARGLARTVPLPTELVCKAAAQKRPRTTEKSPPPKRPLDACRRMQMGVLRGPRAGNMTNVARQCSERPRPPKSSAISRAMVRSAPGLQATNEKRRSERGVRRATAASSNDPPLDSRERVVPVRGVRRRASLIAARDERASPGTGAFEATTSMSAPTGATRPAHPEGDVMFERSVSRNRDAARLSRFGSGLHGLEKLTFIATPFDEYRVGPLIIERTETPSGSLCSNLQKIIGVVHAGRRCVPM